MSHRSPRYPRSHRRRLPPAPYLSGVDVRTGNSSLASTSVPPFNEMSAQVRLIKESPGPSVAYSTPISTERTSGAGNAVSTISSRNAASVSFARPPVPINSVPPPLTHSQTASVWLSESFRIVIRDQQYIQQIHPDSLIRHGIRRQIKCLRPDRAVIDSHTV